MARKTIFDIYNELYANDETSKEVIGQNEVQAQQIEEVNTVEEVKAVETVDKNVNVDIETIQQNNSLQSVISNEERGE